MGIRNTFQAQPTSEEVLKKVEKSILKEAKSEEKNLKHLVKDLAATEKASQKAQKAAEKGEHQLHDAEKREHDTLKLFHKAEHNHDEAISHVHMKKNDLQVEMKRKGYDKAQQSLEAKKAQVDAAIKANDRHAAERNAKLATLQAPAANAATVSQPGPSGPTAS